MSRFIAKTKKSFYPLLTALVVLQGAFVLLPAPAQAAITDGGNALDVIGQYDPLTGEPSYTLGDPNGGYNRFRLRRTQDMVVDAVHHRLFVSEFSDNRVVVYNLNADNTLSDHEQDFVLGQPGFGIFPGRLTQSTLCNPGGVDYD